MSVYSNRNLLTKVWGSLARGGPVGLGRDVRDYLRWRLSGAPVGAESAHKEPLSNWDLNQREMGSLPDILVSRPILVYAEASTRCNLHCFMCRLSFPQTTRRVRQHMRLDTFARLEPLLEPGSRLSLFGLGEPLLSPHFPEMLRMAKGRGAYVGLNSNVMLLTERIARAMVELEQDLLVVSFGGGTRETYERVITGADFERVLANLRRLNEIKLEALSQQHSALSTQHSALSTQHSARSPQSSLLAVKPVLQLQITLMRDNLHELPEVVRLALELGCAGVVAMPLTVVDPSLAEQSILSPELRPQVERAFEAARKMAATAEYPFELQLPTAAPSALSTQHSAPSTQSSVPSPQSSSLCHEPWQTFYVRDDGSVSTCCYSNRVLGDLREQTALEIWNGEPYRRFRARMRSDRKPAECQVCHKLCGGDWYDQRVDEETFYDEL